ncbi:hypothetical protein D6817_05145, partial [Candidatus Pacearchaeota archaeon]
GRSASSVRLCVYTFVYTTIERAATHCLRARSKNALLLKPQPKNAARKSSQQNDGVVEQASACIFQT